MNKKTKSTSRLKAFFSSFAVEAGGRCRSQMAFSGAEPHTERKARRKWSGPRLLRRPWDRPACSHWSSSPVLHHIKERQKIMWDHLAESWNWTGSGPFKRIMTPCTTSKSTTEWLKEEETQLWKGQAAEQIWIPLKCCRSGSESSVKQLLTERFSTWGGGKT